MSITRCEACGRVTFCAADCVYAPWNEDSSRMTRFACLRRMVRWTGGRYALQRYEIAWVRS